MARGKVRVKELGNTKYIDMGLHWRSHFDIGQIIGDVLQEEIAAGLEVHFAENDISNPSAKRMQRQLTKRVEEYFPNFFEEIRGLAQGSGQALEDLLAFSFEEELALHDAKREFGGRCSSLGVKTRNGVLLAHNEDWDLDLPLYLVRAKPKGKPAFLTAAYAGQLPGTCVGLNANQIAFAGNSIETNLYARGQPKTYLLRSLLETRSSTKTKPAINQIAKKIKRFSAAIGNNSLVVDGCLGEMANLEWFGKKCAVLPGEKKTYHTNNFISPSLQKYDICEEEDFETFEDCLRYSRFRELVDNTKLKSMAQVQEIMKDHKRSNKPDTLCKHQDTKNEAYARTIASVIVNPEKLTMYFAGGNPCKAKYYRISLD